MNKKTLSLVGMIIGCVFVLIGILSLSGAVGGNTSYPSSAPYSYDSGYASFGGDYYTYDYMGNKFYTKNDELGDYMFFYSNSLG